MNLYLDLPKPETINKYLVRIEPPLDPKPIGLISAKTLSMKPSAVANRNMRAKYKAQGLNSYGKPYRRKIHPELHGLNNLNLYRKLWLAKRK